MEYNMGYRFMWSLACTDIRLKPMRFLIKLKRVYFWKINLNINSTM